MFPYPFPSFGDPYCCQNEPTSAPEYKPDYHLYCDGDDDVYTEYIEARMACPEHHPYAGDYDHADYGLMEKNVCCSELFDNGHCDMRDYRWGDNKIRVRGRVEF